MSDEHAKPRLTLERLWQFSLQYYSVREVKEACLRLQNSHNGNVNLLLLLKWLDEQQLTLTEADWPTVLECLNHSENLLHSFRDLRRRLKNHLPDTLYREALQFELQLEKQQQADLVECLNRLTLYPAHAIPLTLQYCKMLGAEYLAELFSAPYRESDTPTS